MCLGRLALGLAALAVAGCSGAPRKAAPAPDAPDAPVAAVRDPTARTLRLVGVIEAVRAYSVAAPRLRGQNPGAPMVITLLARGGSPVKQDDIVAELDSQEQDRVARDRQSTVQNLDEQIRKMQADQVAAKARDDTELTVAGSDVERARLTVTTNRLLPQLEAEKNTLSLEQAEARLGELKKTYELKRRAAAADLRILEIRRDRARQELEYAEQNISLMVMSAPFAGLVVPKTTFRNGQMVEIIEGDEARAGMPILDVVDASLMRARVRVNQGDIATLHVGQPARIYLDAYPELAFEGRIEQIAPVAVTSSLTPTVRTFAAVVSINGGHEKLMPDLTAAVEIKTEPQRAADPSATRTP